MRQLPYAVAIEMLLVGEEIDAETALRWGPINRVVEREDLIPIARDLAARIGCNAPLAVRAAKELAVKSRDISLAEGLGMAQFVNLIPHGTEDTRCAKEAFAEKRQPAFKAN